MCRIDVNEKINTNIILIQSNKYLDPEEWKPNNNFTKSTEIMFRFCTAGTLFHFKFKLVQNFESQKNATLHYIIYKQIKALKPYINCLCPFRR